MKNEPSNQVPKVSFDSADFTLDQRLEAFRDVTRSLYHCSPQGHIEDFYVKAKSYMTGDLVFTHVTFSPLHFERDIEKLRGETQDFLVMEIQLKGCQTILMNNIHTRMHPGFIYLRDWSYSYEANADEMDVFSILIPRHRLKVSSSLNSNCPILSWSTEEAAGQMLLTLWTTLFDKLSAMTKSEAMQLSNALIGFLDGLLDHRPQQQGAGNSFDSICQYINARLHGEITTTEVCEYFNISKSTVYRIFKDYGGVKKCILLARLRHCYIELYHADASKDKIKDIFENWGFHDASSFSRAFKNTFNVMPTDVLKRNFDKTLNDKLSNSSIDSSSYEDYKRFFLKATHDLS
ncbi:MAG: hypothetical protein A6F70_09235 [Cycloclasticus sp. symbiont of Bathymodiolus heckerae]|nr:MAG: hypothetical protein A6F70_09235 [Cycloclasticus sp. symbiont of Bathymodiolus heckerae]